MFSISPIWQIALGMLLLAVAYYLFQLALQYIQALFRPFKKGKKYWCRVKAVSDGDTLTCYRFNVRRSATKVRFAYIDAPESNQAYGQESQQLVKRLIQNKIVRVKITDIDRYGRCVGLIHRRGKNINETLVKSGAAWVYEEYVRDRQQLEYLLQLQNQAKKSKKGLWKASKPMKPAEFRRLKKFAS